MTPTELRKLHGKVTRKWVVNDFAEDCCQFTFDEAEYLYAAVNSLPALLDRNERLERVREAALNWISENESGDVHLDMIEALYQDLVAALAASESKEGTK